MRSWRLLPPLLLTLAACSSGGIAPSTLGSSTTPAGPTTTAAPTPTTGATTSAATTTTTTSLVADAPGIGDPYFPGLGNPGYDVTHYLVDLAVDPAASSLAGQVVITATATGNLDRLRLDLLGLTVDAVEVDGAPAGFTREGGELVVDPEAVLPAGASFEVMVTYHGTPEPSHDAGFPAGWSQAEGVTYVVAEPDGARTWLPCNDHPGDKAAFTFRITVPDTYTVAANGSLLEVGTEGGEATFVWDMPEPMATYLATVVIGDLERVEGGIAAGVLLRDYLPAGLADDPPALLSRVGDMLQFFSGRFGPFPFSEYGHAILPVAEAQEDQTLCLLGWGDRLDSGDYDEGIVSHELSHQWFGDSVTPATWQDIWLNEGFATFAQWLWLEHTAGRAAYDEQISKTHRRLQPGDPLPGDPGPRQLFADSVYQRGGLALHALRVTVGDATLFEILRTWTLRFAYGNASTADFVALAEEISGRELESLFQAWLFDREVPALPAG